MLKRMLFVSLAVMAGGCVTEGVSIPIGEARYAATDPASVTLLVSEPSKPHAVIALVEGIASTDDYLTVKKTQSVALDAMLKEAARVGAHAVIITGKQSSPDGGVIFGSASGTQGFFTTVGTSSGFEKIRISGTAIRYTE